MSVSVLRSDQVVVALTGVSTLESNIMVHVILSELPAKI